MRVEQLLLDGSLPKHLEYAYRFGFIKYGWALIDYIMHASIAHDGYETVVVDGVQRVGKSNFTLQISGWAKAATIILRDNKITVTDYLEATDPNGEQRLRPSKYLQSQPKKPTQEEIWRRVLDDKCFKSGEFVQILKNRPKDDPLDSLAWDDINGHYTNMAFRINVEEYSQIDATFTVIGTKAKIIITNIPNVTRLAKNIKDTVTMEVFIGPNRKKMVKRVVRLPGLRGMNMNEFKVDIEPYSGFDIYKIPAWAWYEYEDERESLAEEVLESLEKVANSDEAPEGYLTVYDCVIMAKDAGVNWGVSTIQQNASRGLWGKAKVANKMFIEESSFKQMLEAESYQTTH